MNRVILITGVPCTRKTTFGRKLREAGWLHLDAEARSRNILHKLIDEGKIVEACLELQRIHHKSVVTYGMPVAYMKRMVPELQDVGVECYFFTDNLSQAKQRWAEREGRDPQGPEARQFEELEKTDPAFLKYLFRHRIVLPEDVAQLQQDLEAAL